MERFMPNATFSAPIEMEFAPSGDLYVLEYGTRWFQGNEDARLVRIEYNAGNRPPIALAAVDQPKGALPLRVVLSSAGTEDLDEDSLRYDWTITRRGAVVARSTAPNPAITLRRAGTYTATLTVTDAQGAAASSAPIEIVAGNQPPAVGIDLVGSNTTFFFPDVPVGYAVRVTDREDGTLRSGRIPGRRVGVSAQYHKDGPAASPVDQGRQLIEAGDCLSCHQVRSKSVGPAYIDVAHKYQSDTAAPAHLRHTIRTGGSGVWAGSVVAMPAHPALTDEQAAAMVAYILSLADTTQAPSPALPVRGTYTPPAGSGDAPQGVVQLRAAYTDRGANGMPAITTEHTLELRSPTVIVANGDLSDGVSKETDERVPVPIALAHRSGTSVTLPQIDLTGVAAVTFMVAAPTAYQAQGGKIAVYLDSLTGPLLGESEAIRPTSDEAPVSRRVSLQPATGAHDLYFAFTNPDAPAGGNGFLFAVLTATFEATAAAGPPTPRSSH
jgi:cytochrome c